jgi:hypothetical protein
MKMREKHCDNAKATTARIPRLMRTAAIACALWLNTETPKALAKAQSPNYRHASVAAKKENEQKTYKNEAENAKMENEGGYTAELFVHFLSKPDSKNEDDFTSAFSERKIKNENFSKSFFSKLKKYEVEHLYEKASVAGEGYKIAYLLEKVMRAIDEDDKKTLATYDAGIVDEAAKVVREMKLFSNLKSKEEEAGIIKEIRGKFPGIEISDGILKIMEETRNVEDIAEALSLSPGKVREIIELMEKEYLINKLEWKPTLAQRVLKTAAEVAGSITGLILLMVGRGAFMRKMDKKKEETEKRIDEAVITYGRRIDALIQRIDKVKTLEELEEIDEEEKKIYKEIEKKHKGNERERIINELADIAKWYNIKYEGKFSRFTGMRPVNF